MAQGRNEPGELPRIAAVFAALREMPLEEVTALTGANARRIGPPTAPSNARG